VYVCHRELIFGFDQSMAMACFGRNVGEELHADAASRRMLLANANVHEDDGVVRVARTIMPPCHIHREKNGAARQLPERAFARKKASVAKEPMEVPRL